MTMKTTRRDFLKQLGALAALAIVSPSDAARKVEKSANKKRLVILHTNDVHSRIEPYPPEDLRYGNKGGYARRQALIEKVRSEGYETLVFESGDIFQGTPYFNFYHGALEISLMNRMGIDAVTIGNHEFDLGLENLNQRMSEANFPFLCANYTFSNARSRELVKPWKVFERCGKRIGVLGLGVKLDGLVTTANHGNTVYEDAIECGNRTANELKQNQGCDLVIALTHIGYDGLMGEVNDRSLAAQTENIDIILGGHSHTFLPSPVWVTNKVGRQVLVNQAGCGGVAEGRIDVRFDGDTAQIDSCSNLTIQG